MGKKLQGAKLRAKKRSKLAAQNSLETKAEEAETQQVTTKANEELFVVDTTAVLPSKKQLVKKEQKKRKFSNSAKEEAQINKLVDTHSPTKLQELAKVETAKRARIKKDVDPSFDLWGDDGDDKTPKSKKGRTQSKKKQIATSNPGIGPSLAGTKPAHKPSNYSITAMPDPNTKKVSVDVAEAGQSYNPDRIQHRNVIAKAVEVEEKRQRAEELNAAPISKGMSEETKAYLLEDSDLDDDSSDESDSGEPKEKGPIEKKKDKLTRAQRNRQKRIKQELYDIAQRKKDKKFQNSVAEAKVIAKQLRKEEAEKRQKAQALNKLKEESERTKGKNVYHQLADENPVDAPTYPVALSSELKNHGGSLRTIKPKGSLVNDRMASFMDRGMAAKKQLKQKRIVSGKRRKFKVKVRGKGFEASKEGGIMG
ncbi:unnamed protein product [Cylindrotheca closterium]|uniref:Ribosome biogenesis protein NOP53 n=1 Tax=Cylindrotheca closterium TaxID=2856 RepID=A0AAD2CJJ7_9STRA|nr:unnamed protein product [Cylindrotheca closterium]